MPDDFSKPPPNRTAEQNAAKQGAQLSAQQQAQRQQQIKSQDVTKTREQAPGAIQSGSEQETFVRQEAAKAEQQKMVEGGYGKGATKDQYAGAREAALKAGSFSYSTQTPASLPSTINKEGKTTVRNQDLYKGAPIQIQKPKEETVTISTPKGSRTVTGEQALISRLKTNYASATPPQQKQSSSTQKTQGTPQSNQINSILRQNLSNKEGQAASDISGKTEPEAVPFLSLKSPIKVSVVPVKAGETFKTRGRGASGAKTGQKVQIIIPEQQGTKEIPATSIIDVLQFAPIGGIGLGGARAALRGTGSIVGTIKSTPEVFKTGQGLERVSSQAITVPKGVKPPEETLLGKVQAAFSKPQPKAETKPPQQFTSTEISLGRGTGKEPEGKGGVLSGKGTGGGTKPSGGTPKETTSRSGQVLQQIEKEKEPKTTTKTTTKTEQINKAITREKEPTTTKARSKVKPETTEEQIPILLTRPPSTRTTPKETRRNPLVPVIPISVPAPPQPKTKPKEEERLGIVDLLQTQKNIQTPKQGTEQTTIFDTLQTQVTRQTPKQTQEPITFSDLVYTEKGGGETPKAGAEFGGLGGNPGLIGKVSSGGSKKNYLGNVPIDDIIGIGKQEELTYKESTIKTRSQAEERRASSGSFVGSPQKGKVKFF
uniref:ORF25 n=1 Tax=Nitrosopumilaceae spindle-shaped virus TaxID=3065433 RepID=A0AAT9JAJ5_9VIRU